MGYVVYECPKVREAEEYVRKGIEELSQKLQVANPAERAGFLPYFEALGRGYFKRRMDKYQLIAHRINILYRGDRIPVVVLLDILPRDSGEYGGGGTDALIARYEKRIRDSYPEITKYIEQYQTDSPLPVSLSLPAPPPTLQSLLVPLQLPKRTTAVYESRVWRESFLTLTRDTERAAVFEALGRIVSHRDEFESRRLWVEKACEIYYVRLQDPQCQYQHLFLLGVISKNWEPEQYHSYLNKIDSLWNELQSRVIGPIHGQSSHCSHWALSDALGRYAVLAYPDFLLCDEELWQSIETHKETFLPLSTEEIGVLERLLTGEVLPTIIEGRAGSGKSTLLIYYVPERLLKCGDKTALLSDYPVHLLYLTQNRRLLEGVDFGGVGGPIQGAKKLIERLKNRMQIQYGTASTGIEEHYSIYHDFAIGQLPEQCRYRFQERSERGGWIGFAQFRKLLRNPQHGPQVRLSRDVTAELAWFIIRSYIKGFLIHEEGEDRWMSPDQYAESDVLARKDRQVSPEVYREVWDKVWPWYKRATVGCRENNYQPKYWDDLDLAWEVLLNRDRKAPTYAILVCDEAQDFTRVEFAALFSSLTWRNYDLTTLGEVRLPVVLAGDAHQTINPSCFRWARVRQDCAKALVQHLPDAPLPKVSREELGCNYRNAYGIAQLCNVLQRLRQEALGHSGKLQQVWCPPDDHPEQRIQRLLVKDGTLLSELIESGALVIGPEPADPKDESSRSFWEALGVSEPPAQALNYETPVDIKGLESEVVGILGFGTLFSQLDLCDFWQWQDAWEREDIPEKKRFAAEYFLNRLYVAVSRPREQLWIIETDEGWNAFWAPLEARVNNDAAFSPDMEHIPMGFLWSDGDFAEFQRVSSRDYLSKAQQCEAFARDDRSEDQASRAGFYFGLAGRKRDADRMKAWETYYGGRVKEAADQMWNISERRRASDWYWESAAWQQMTDRPIEPRWRSELAAKMLVPETARDAAWCQACYQILSGLSEKRILEDPYQRTGFAWNTWSVVLLAVLEAGAKIEEEKSALKQLIRDLLRPLAPADEHFSTYRRWQSCLGRLNFQLKDYPSAAQNWECAGETNHRDYFVAKAQIASYPESLRWWDSAAQWEEVSHRYESYRDTISLSVDDLRRVIRAYLQLDRKEDALILAVQVDSREAARIWHQMASEGDPTYLMNVIEKMYGSLRESAPPDRFSRAWADLLLDMLLEIEQPGTVWPEKMWRPVCHGFRFSANPGALLHRFRGSWEKRESPESKWSQFMGALTQLVHGCRELIVEDWRNNRFDRAACLAWVALGLVWEFRDRPSEKETKLEKRLPRFVAIPAFLEKEQDGQRMPDTFDYFDRLEPWIRPVAVEALQCVAHGPPEWVRKHRKSLAAIVPKLPYAVDALAYELSTYVHTALAAVQKPGGAPSFDWLLIGRFIEQAPFRRAALDYYTDLLKFADLFNWDESQIREVTDRLRVMKIKYEKWKTEKEEK